MSCIEEIKKELEKYSDIEKAGFMQKYFKTLPGGYGEGDVFIGVKVPDERKIAKKFYKEISLKDTGLLLNERIHEYRFTGTLILVYKFEKAASEEERKEIKDFYIDNLKDINNWDLVDVSAEHILGGYLFDKEDKSILFRFAESRDLWKQRVAIISTFYFIRKSSYSETFEIAKLLLNHKHDLIHKAVGWMLREVGDKDLEAEIEFLKEHYKDMPRTMLRYAIEKFEENLRQDFLKGNI